MTLPPVTGWVIDFRTARTIFSSGSNVRISHCVDLCSSGHLHFCHCEEAEFKSVPQLKAAFLDDQNCMVVPDDLVMEKCLGMAGNPLSQKRFTGNDGALFLPAIAASKGYGLISDHRSITFTTAFDLCDHYGIPALSSQDYFVNALITPS